MRLCILGGGFGGLYTALALSRYGWVKAGNCQITLIEPKDRFLFTPLLYELLTGELQPWEIAPTYEKILRNTQIQFCQQAVETVDLKSHQVTLKSGEQQAYDYLVLAVGSQNRWANIPGVSTQALTFRSLADVERLQASLRSLEASDRLCLRVAIIGGGPNGVELGAKLADRLGKRGQVHLIECGEQILPNFSASVRVAAYRALLVRKLQIHLKTSVTAIATEQITVNHEGQINTIMADLVLWTAGTQTRDWLRQLDCQQTAEGKLLTRPSLQLVEYPEVFALGDIAAIGHGSNLVPATAQAAYQQASFASKNIMAAMRGKPLRAFRYLHLGDMLTVGKGAAIVSSFFLTLEGAIADVIRQLVYIQRLPTWRHRLQVLKNWFFKFIRKRSQFDCWQLKRFFAPKSAKSEQKSSR